MDEALQSLPRSSVLRSLALLARVFLACMIDVGEPVLTHLESS